MSAFTDAVEAHTGDLYAFSVGSCPGCSECGGGEPLSHEQWESGEVPADEGHFSWRACESCGSTFGGSRYPEQWQAHPS